MGHSGATAERWNATDFVSLYDRFIYRYLYIPFTLPYRLCNIREWITINGLREEGLWGKSDRKGARMMCGD